MSQEALKKIKEIEEKARKIIEHARAKVISAAKELKDKEAEAVDRAEKRAREEGRSMMEASDKKAREEAAGIEELSRLAIAEMKKRTAARLPRAKEFLLKRIG